MSDPLLIYGANGYTGRLIAQHAVESGLRPILAGRSIEKVRTVAGPLELEARAFPLSEPKAIIAGLASVRCVIHAAGPFSETAPPMLAACLAAGVHYLDITGEIDVFEQVAALDADARQANIMLLPGTGFDVVPSDCLGSYVASHVEKPVHLRVGVLGLGGSSKGTAKTAIQSIDQPARARRDGKIVSLDPTSLAYTFDFGRGPKPTIPVSWGDVATAYYSTGIPNITAYFPAMAPGGLLRLSRALGPILKTSPVQSLLKKAVDLFLKDPSEAQREEKSGVVVAEVEAADGARTSARLVTPSPYKLTYLSCVDLANRVLDGDWQPGFKTPSLAYGSEYIFSLPGCRLDADLTTAHA